jgi:hypothetical protein
MFLLVYHRLRRSTVFWPDKSEKTFGQEVAVSLMMRGHSHAASVGIDPVILLFYSSIREFSRYRLV